MTTYTLAAPVELVNGGHNAFPGAARLANGRVVVVYRHGEDHVGGVPGVIKEIHSDDLGLSWSTPVTVLSETGIDLRDPTLVLLDDGRLAMTLFRHAALTALDVNVSYSSNGGTTWTTPAALPFGFTDWAACSGPIAEPTPGRLWAFAYGQDTADAYDSVRSITSTDNGATWGDAATLLDGQADSRFYQEPFGGVLYDGRVMVDVRGGTDAVRRRLIRTGSTWTTTTLTTEPIKGRPAWFQSSQGHIIIGDRRQSGTSGVIGWQEDEAAAISPLVKIQPTGENRGTYQQMVELEDGAIGVAYAYETSVGYPNDSRLCWTTYTPDTYDPLPPQPTTPRRRGASAAVFL